MVDGPVFSGHTRAPNYTLKENLNGFNWSLNLSALWHAYLDSSVRVLSSCRLFFTKEKSTKS